jgi:hypothetical protein
MDECLSFHLLLKLSALGVRRIDLTQQAMDGLTGRLKGLYEPNLPEVIGTDEDCVGKMVGIEFYVSSKDERETEHG